MQFLVQSGRQGAWPACAGRGESRVVVRAAVARKEGTTKVGDDDDDARVGAEGRLGNVQEKAGWRRRVRRRT